MQRTILTILSLMITAPAFAQSPTPETKKAEKYLRSLDTVRAKFIQKSSEGGRLSGTFYLDRPGRLRFEYNEVEDFVVADGFLIYFYDAELGEQTHTPIGLSLADFLLRSDLTLEDDITVQDVKKERGHTMLTLTQTEEPEAGSLQLVFSNVPYDLKKWRVTDPQGMITEVELNDIEKGLDLPYDLFAYHNPNKQERRLNE